MSDLMTMSEAAELAEAEQVIERGIQTFTEVGNALLRIRDGRLYRADFGTFEDYCQERWGINRDYANKMIRASAVVDSIVSAGLPAPANEGQARELAKVPEPERAEVWRETVERTSGKPTAAAIRATYRRDPDPEPEPEPTRPEHEEKRPDPEPGIWYSGPAEPEPAPVPAPTRSSGPPPMTEEERQERLRLVAKQEYLNAYSEAMDGLIALESYVNTYTPPADIPANYPSLSTVITRIESVLSTWKNWNASR